MTKVNMTPPQYVSYDTEGVIVGVGPAPVDGYDHFITEYDKVERFLTLKDDPMNFLVRYSSQNKAYKLVSLIIEKDKEYKFIKVEPLTSKDYDLLLKVNTQSKTATLIADNVLATKLNTKKFTFYFTKKDNPNYLYRTIEFTLDQELQDDVLAEANYISIYTVRNLEKICFEAT